MKAFHSTPQKRRPDVDMDRRDALKLGGVALLTPIWSVALSGCGGANDSELYHAFLPPVEPLPIVDAQLGATIGWILETPQSGLMQRARKELLAGLAPAMLDAAVLLANFRLVASFAAGDAHRMLAWQALNPLRAGMAPTESMEWSLWLLHLAKRDVSLNKWGVSSYTPPKSFPAAGDARQRYEDAVRGGDVSSAEAAAMALYRDGGWSAMIDPFYRMGVSGLHELAHSAIGAAHYERTVATLGAEHAELFVRFQARSQAYQFEKGTVPAKDTSPYFSNWTTNVSAARSMVAPSSGGSLEPDATVAVIEAVRAGSVPTALATVRDLWGSGVSASSLWDGLVCAAAEQMFVDRSGTNNLRGGEVHAFTNVNAMRNGFLSTGVTEETRRLLLLQATAFATLFKLEGKRHTFDDLVADPAAGKTLDEMRATLGAGEIELNPDQTLPIVDEAKQRSVANALLAYVDDGGDVVRLVTDHITHIRTTAKHTHSVKFPAALLEELGRVGTAHRRRLVPALGFYMNGGSAAMWSAYSEAASVAAEVVA